MAPLQHHFELLGWDEITDRDPVLDHHRHLRRGRARASSTPSGSPAHEPRRRSARCPAAARRCDRGTGVRARRRRLRRLRVRGRRQPAPTSAPRSPCSTSPRTERPAREGRRCSRCSAPTVRLGAGATATLPEDVDLVVTSPGWPPDRAAARRGGRARASRSGARSSWPGGCATPSTPRPGSRVTGTNGKTTTVQMLDAILRAGGPAHASPCGNVGLPIVEAVMDPEPYDVLAVELSSFQLHYTDSMSARVRRRAQRRRGPPRLVRRPDAMDATPPTRAGSTSGVQRACVYNVADPVTERLVREADVVEGARAIGFTLGMPARRHGRASSTTCSPTGPSSRSGDVQRRRAVHASPTSPRPAPHFVANALAAAALARAHGVPPAAVRDGLRAFRPDGHRIADGRRASTASPTSTTPRRPTRTRRCPRCRPTTRSCGSPAAWPRAPRFDDLVRRGRATGCAASCCSAATAT